ARDRQARARRARQGRTPEQGAAQPDRALGRRAAARRHRAGDRAPALAPSRRRTDGQPRYRALGRHPRPVPRLQRPRRDRRHRHPRSAPDPPRRQAHARAQARRAGARLARARRHLAMIRFLRTYMRRHVYALRVTVSQLFRAPLSTLMTIGVIGITLALPTGLYLLIANLERMSAGLDAGGQISLFLKRDVPEAAAQRLAERIQRMRAVERVE